MDRTETRKPTITERIGEEIVDELLEAGLAILLVLAGVSYFNLENNWTQAAALMADKVGLVSVESEVSMMYNSVVNGGIFMFFKNHFLLSIVVAILLCIGGITFKILTLKSKEEFIKDMGKVILVPGLVGLLAIILIQILTVSSLNDLFVRSNLATMELALDKMSSGMMIWNMMGIIFMTGIFSLIFGSMLVYVVKALKERLLFLRITGNFLALIGWFFLGYYAIMRLLAIDMVASSLYGGNILKLFVFVWYMSRGTFITAVCMFALGFTLYKYGKKEIRRKRRLAIMESRREQMIIGRSPYEGQTHYPPYTGHEQHNPYK